MSGYPLKMKAVVAHNKFDYRLEEVPTPSIGSKDVILNISGCGICGGDAKAYYGGDLFWGNDKKKGWMRTPVIPGHEFIGTVVAIGDEAAEKNGLKVGDKAIAEQILPCGKCLFCRTGKYWMCEVHNVFGFQGDVANGGMAEYIKLPENAIIHKVPHSLSDEIAVAIEPVSIAAYTVSKGNIELGDTVVIAGAGPIGLFITQIVKLKNPSKVVVIDPIKKRREIAVKKGADMVLDPSSDDLIGVIREITAGYGCDVYIEASGHPDAVDQGLQVIRKLGRYVALGVSTKYASVDWDMISDRKELTILGAHLSPCFYPVAIEYLQNGKISVDGIITHRLKLEEFKEGFEMVHNPDESIKVVLVP